MILETPTVAIDEPGVRVVAVRELCVIVWKANSSAASLRRVLAHEKQQATSVKGGKLLILTVVEAPALALPDAEMRALLESTRAELQRFTRAEAVVLPSGFVAATIRGLIAGIMLVQKPPHPNKVVNSLDEACEFLAPQFEPVHGERPAPAQLAALVRAQMTPAAK